MNWKQLFTNNIGWKLSSLFIATMIWSNYHSDELGLDLSGGLFRNHVTKEIFGYQVQLLNSPLGPNQVEVAPRTLALSITGEREIITATTKEDMLVYIDISNLSLGSSNNVPVQVKVPPGVRIDYVRPSNVLVRVPAPAPAN